MSSPSQKISSQLNLQQWQVNHVIQLLEEGATIPFIARYRKEKTGNLDEVKLQSIQHGVKYFEALEKRRKFILETIDES